jgi:conjugal transfer pilus assembly protein TraW
MLETIEQRLTALEESGELARIEDDAKARYQAYVERPEGVRLPRATQNRTYYADPSLIVPYDIKDHEGRIIHSAGTTVNPLDYMTLSKQLLFFDGDDPGQVEWARAMVGSDPVHIKPILTNGPVLALMKEWQVRLYFDQRGQLVERFGIQRVPAMVSQEEKRLKVAEHGIGDPG